MKASIFRNFTIWVEDKSIIVITKDIKEGKYKNQVTEIRNLIANGNEDEADALKKQLLAFTPSGTFQNGRNTNLISEYSGIIVLDIDDITELQIDDVINKVAAIPHTFAAFISPSGKGVKILVSVSSSADNHRQAFAQVAAFYESALNIKIDPSGKDICRLCFMSYDPNCFRNINPVPFNVTLQQSPIASNSTLVNADAPTVNSDNPADWEEAFGKCIDYTEKKLAYEKGKRNNFIYSLACNCNRVGIPQSITEYYCEKKFDLPLVEMIPTINSVYINNNNENKSVDIKSLDIFEEDKNSNITMLTLPISIFETMPNFLKQITTVGTTVEERDILLLGSLVTLSVAFPKIIGIYGDNPVNSNLFIFISAKASAGKGILIHCRKLVEPIHLDLRKQAKLMMQQFNDDMQEYNAIKGKNARTEKPEKPPQKMLFIPANNSSTGFFELLNDSDGKGIIFETEADTLSKSFKSEHGNFSDGLRNAFQHEPHSYYRRTDKELVEITRPCLSVMLSGTPKQVQTLIPNAENGLFSRFIFYVMNMKLIWKDVFASKTEKGLDVHFEKLGNEFYNLYQSLQANPAIQFSLTPLQQLQFNQFFEKMQTLYVNIQEEEIISSVRRLGLIAYRIMMIFSALRIMEDGEITTTLYCNDIDFQNTLDMITILVKHSSYVYSQIAQESYKPKPKHKKEQFLETLPYHFNRKSYVAIALNLGITDKSAQRYIKEFKDADIIQYDGHDKYTNPTVTISK